MNGPFSRIIEAVVKIATNLGGVVSNITGNRLADALEVIAEQSEDIRTGTGGSGSGLPDASELPDGTAAIVVDGQWKMQPGYGYYGEPQFDDIEWDGNDTGHTVVQNEDFKFVKVNDEPLDFRKIVGSEFSYTETYDGEVISYRILPAMVDQMSGMFFAHDGEQPFFISVYSEGADFYGLTFEEVGVYFTNLSDAPTDFSLKSKGEVFGFDPIFATSLSPWDEGSWIYVNDGKIIAGSNSEGEIRAMTVNESFSEEGHAEMGLSGESISFEFTDTDGYTTNVSELSVGIDDAKCTVRGKKEEGAFGESGTFSTVITPQMIFFDIDGSGLVGLGVDFTDTDNPKLKFGNPNIGYKEVAFASGS